MSFRQACVQLLAGPVKFIQSPWRRLIVNRKSTPIPEPIAQLQRELEEFRSTQSRRTKLPEPLWQAAVELARQYGVYPVAHPLRLDYMRLKKQLGGLPTRRQRRVTKPAFVEFIAPGLTMPEEYVIEFESCGGSKMRIQWKSTAPPDWTNLLRAWRDADR